MVTIELEPIEHRKPLRLYVVLGQQDGYWIALRGFRSLRRAVRYANRLERWAIADEAQIIDSYELKENFFREDYFPLESPLFLAD